MLLRTRIFSQFDRTDFTPQKFETCPRWGASKMSLWNPSVTRHPIFDFRTACRYAVENLAGMRCPTSADNPDCRLGRSAQATYGDSFRNRRFSSPTPDRRRSEQNLRPDTEG